MAPIAARDARHIVSLAEEVAAIHLLAACQALDLRGKEQMSPRIRRVHDLVRSQVPFTDGDRRMDGDIASVVELIRSGAVGEVADVPKTAAVGV
jgi:histidine ammonia-lyase/phenylalanine ammonia-lyase